MCDCDRALELISRRLDGALDEAGRRELDGHLASCEACRSLARDLEELHAAVPELEVEVPEGFRQSVMDKVRAEKPLPFPAEGKRPRQWRRWVSMAAVFAVILVGAGTLGRFPNAGTSGGSGANMAAAPMATAGAGGVESGLAKCYGKAETAPPEPAARAAQGAEGDPVPAPEAVEDQRAAPWVTPALEEQSAAPQDIQAPEDRDPASQNTTAPEGQIAPFAMQEADAGEAETTALRAPTEEERRTLSENSAAWVREAGWDRVDAGFLSVAAVTQADLTAAECGGEEDLLDLGDWRVTIGDATGGDYAVLLCDGGTLEVLGYIPTF